MPTTAKAVADGGLKRLKCEISSVGVIGRRADMIVDWLESNLAVDAWQVTQGPRPLGLAKRRGTALASGSP